jgi:hypothetical protein
MGPIETPRSLGQNAAVVNLSVVTASCELSCELVRGHGRDLDVSAWTTTPFVMEPGASRESTRTSPYY